MELVERSIKLNDLLLDVGNPRFVGDVENNQDVIQTFIMEKPETKVLLKSMIQQVRWVNRMVVRKLEDSEKYVLVEGNTRTACLKTGKVLGIDSATMIPVLEAVKEEDESDQHYLEEIKIIQGIANVMAVKDWPAVQKAKHLFDMFETKRENHPSQMLNELIRGIGDSMGIKTAAVQKSIKMHGYFLQISKLTQSLDKQDFSYLEAFDVNDITRAFFGYNSDNFRFSWEGAESITEDMLVKQARLKAAPQLIRVTKNEIKSLSFRKLFPKAVRVDDDSVYYKLIAGELKWRDVELGNIFKANPKEDEQTSDQEKEGTDDSGENEANEQPVDDQNSGDSTDGQEEPDIPLPDMGNESPDDSGNPVPDYEKDRINVVMWKYKKYFAEHIDKVSDIPFYLSVEHKKIEFYSQHKFYKLISTKKHYFSRLLVLLAIQEADGNTRNKEEFKHSISDELFEIWGGV